MIFKSIHVEECKIKFSKYWISRNKFKLCVKKIIMFYDKLKTIYIFSDSLNYDTQYYVFERPTTITVPYDTFELRIGPTDRFRFPLYARGLFLVNFCRLTGCRWIGFSSSHVNNNIIWRVKPYTPRTCGTGSPFSTAYRVLFLFYFFQRPSQA